MRIATKIIMGLAGIAILGLAGCWTTASAADNVPIFQIQPQPLLQPTAYDWSGPYIGVTGGLAAGDFLYPWAYEYVGDGTDPDVTGSAGLTSRGFTGGAEAGYSWQFQNGFVIGVAVDGQFSNIEGRADISIDGIGAASAGSTVNWLVTGRGKIGYAFDRFLIYGTGGVAHGDVATSANIGPSTFTSSGQQTGWTAGAGAEYALTENLSIKTEYSYTDLGSQNVYAGPVGGGDNLNVDVSTQFHAVKAGLNFRF